MCKPKQQTCADKNLGSSVQLISHFLSINIRALGFLRLNNFFIYIFICTHAKGVLEELFVVVVVC